ncbi:hypothetical protein C8R44DRAFT_980505 [Mycena epipterygia]|nr:hypothetical protein C8R44DRAFT_980505 [Mycena epipterygia]
MSMASPQMVLGPFYFGVVLNTFLYGILVLQTLHRHFGNSTFSSLFPLFLAGAYWTGISVVQAHTYINKRLVDHGALTWSISAAVSDAIITISLITSLKRRKTGVKPTDDAINRIIRNALQTGAITVAFNILNVALFVALPSSTLNFVFDFALPKLYSSALVSTLNAREGMVQVAEQPEHNVLFSGSTGQSTTSSSVTFNKRYPRAEFIEMNSDTLRRGAEFDDPYKLPE